MNRQTIEQAADNYAANATPSYTNGDFDRHAIAEAFECGADWRINSVWHDTTEKPEFGDTKGVWIVMYFEHGMLSTTFARKDEWYELRKSNNFTRWAYQEDLFPERKEDAK